MEKIISAPDYHFQSDGEDGWIKRPGRIKMALHLESVDTNDSDVENIIANKKLSILQRKNLKNRMLALFKSFDNLNIFLLSQQSDVPAILNSTELQTLWHTYLISSREHLDEVGKYIHICFGLKESTSGINEKKINSLLRNIEKAEKYKEGNLNILEEIITQYKDKIIFHIELRNQNKIERNTLKESPCINPSDKPTGGTIFNKYQNKEVDFMEYLYQSFADIVDFTKMILVFCKP